MKSSAFENMPATGLIKDAEIAAKVTEDTRQEEIVEAEFAGDTDKDKEPMTMMDVYSEMSAAFLEERPSRPGDRRAG